MPLKPRPQPPPRPDAAGIRHRLHTIIFEADTFAGRLFDLALIGCILASVLVVMLDSVPSMQLRHGRLFLVLEWAFTLMFTLEYLLRLFCIGRPLRYALSFYGVVDLLSIVPTYLSLLLPGSQYLLTIRVLRILRIFRVMKLVQYVGEAEHLVRALRASGKKITVFLFAIGSLVIIFGSLIYLIEGEKAGFGNLFEACYYAIVTLSTVGYGDLTPQTPLGKAISALIMILGYSIIAVPTGIVSVELAQARKLKISTQVCPDCSAEGHDPDAAFCKYCGSRL
ncbi:voltage-gated potassium channel [Geothermobacter ehrlichii]|uniref:Voltage-gated potassium channel n=1 Tax=Geothermobacter ehrlichii TaxID=213224 RepID=A0A5D3WKV0_9BACT|nr:ion transporter [Geothermobacter ehrlichii]TYO98120.1 voltage-gated potassium channel [Geothermobacter ehrlichii]